MRHTRTGKRRSSSWPERPVDRGQQAEARSQGGKEEPRDRPERREGADAKRLVALEKRENIAVAERDTNEDKIQVEEGKARVLALAIQEVHKRLSVLQTAIDGMRNDIKVTVDRTHTLQTDLVKTTDDLITRSPNGQGWRSWRRNWPPRSSS